MHCDNAIVRETRLLNSFEPSQCHTLHFNKDFPILKNQCHKQIVVIRQKGHYGSQMNLMPWNNLPNKTLILNTQAISLGLSMTKKLLCLLVFLPCLCLGGRHLKQNFFDRQQHLGRKSPPSNSRHHRREGPGHRGLFGKPTYPGAPAHTQVKAYNKCKHIINQISQDSRDPTDRQNHQ